VTEFLIQRIANCFLRQAWSLKNDCFPWMVTYILNQQTGWKGSEVLNSAIKKFAFKSVDPLFIA